MQSSKASSFSSGDEGLTLEASPLNFGGQFILISGDSVDYPDFCVSSLFSGSCFSSHASRQGISHCLSVDLVMSVTKRF